MHCHSAISAGICTTKSVHTAQMKLISASEPRRRARASFAYRYRGRCEARARLAINWNTHTSSSHPAPRHCEHHTTTQLPYKTFINRGAQRHACRTKIPANGAAAKREQNSYGALRLTARCDVARGMHAHSFAGQHVPGTQCIVCVCVH